MQLSSIGVWSGVFRQAKPEVVRAAAEVEDLGYGAIWMPGGQPAGLADHLHSLLKATRRGGRRHRHRQRVDAPRRRDGRHAPRARTGVSRPLLAGHGDQSPARRRRRRHYV